MKIWLRPQVRSTLKYLWILSLLLLIWQGYTSYSRLSERLATHFDASGNPNGWSSREGFFRLWYLTIFGMNAAWLLALALTPRMLRSRFRRTVNIPNKDYWLATDERIEQYARLSNTLVFGISFLINILFAAIYHSIIQSNIETRLHIGMWGIYVPAGIILAFTLIYMLTAFRKPAE